MSYLYEQCNLANSLYESFIFKADKSNFPVRPHMHYFMELLFMVEETSIVATPKQDYLLKKGEFMLLSPYTIHSMLPASDRLPTYYVIKFDISSLYLASNHVPKLSSLFSNFQENLHSILHIDQETGILLNLEQYFQTCTRELQDKEYGYDIRIQVALIDMLVQIMRHQPKAGESISSRYFSAATLSENFILKLPEYIDQHSQEVIRVEHLAKLCNMSYSNFAKRFHALYGQSCKSYIEFVRISKTKDFLTFTDYDLTYISQECGFSDCSHFIRTFRKVTGTTPNQFRIQNSGMK